MRTISSTEAKAKLNALLADIERTGASITITNHGRAVAVLGPVQSRPRAFGILPSLQISESFDDPLPESELAAWESGDV